MTPYFPVAPLPLTPPGVGPVPDEPAALQMLNAFKEAPLLGLEFVAEILRPQRDPLYHCFLCSREVDIAGLVKCVTSAQHRLIYLVSFE